MTITVSEEEAVIRDGERWSIGEKVYGEERAGFGVGYIQEIEVYGVHFGFKAKIESIILDSPIWVDSRNLTKEPTIDVEAVEESLQKQNAPTMITR